MIVQFKYPFVGAKSNSHVWLPGATGSRIAGHTVAVAFTLKRF